MASPCGRQTNEMNEISSEFEFGVGQRFSYRSLQIATTFFSNHNLIRGGYPKWYRGVLPNGTRIAVREYDSEREMQLLVPCIVEVFSCIRHLNIDGVIGYCFHKNRILLVSGYMSNGSLGDLLRDKEKRESVFNWPMRVAVCNGIARGLHHLHQQTNPCIIHRDIKPSNILLDSNFTPKITGFEIVKLVYKSHIEEETDLIMGTIYYIDPEYFQTNKCSPKSDVYGFGVVMLEIICGTKVTSYGVGPDKFVRQALDLLEIDRVLEVVDPVLADFPVDQVLGFLNVAFSCVKREPVLRPSMGEVIQMLIGVCDSTLKPSEMQSSTPYLSAASSFRSSVEGESSVVYEETELQEGEDESSVVSEGTEIQEGEIEEIASELGEAHKFSYLSLQAATNNFSDHNLVRVDGFAQIYKGVLPNGTLIAVTKYSRTLDSASPPTVEVLSRIRHPNIDRVIGYCFHKNHRLLVSLYMSNGSLLDLLHDKEKSETLFNWPMRVGVCNGIARGIHHLHEQTNPCVIHRDIKSSNVLLDNNFTPKITGFDIGKFIYKSHLEEKEEKEEKDNDMVMGTLPYLDPEYFQTNKCTPKSDVYGFGVVMLDIICGRNVTSLDLGSVKLVQRALGLLEIDRVSEVVDPVLADFPLHQVLGFLNVAFSCVNLKSVLRPNMAEVIQMLSGVCDSPLKPFEMQSSTPYLSAASSFRSSVEGESSVVYEETELQEGEDESSVVSEETELQEGEIEEIASELGEAHKFSYLSLQAATNNFSDHNLVRVGGFAQIYKGVLPNGTLIAVTKYSRTLDSGTVEVLSRIRHPNIDRVIGYCLHKNHLLLVSIYMSNGSLFDLLCDKEKSETVFNWPMRVGVCKGIARGIHHLHKQINPCVIHRDIKSSNVLLDNNFTPKITGFDIVKFVYKSHLEEEDNDMVMGTLPYLDPEYFQTNKCTPKSDVYGFGVVMLDIICGRNVTSLDLGSVKLVQLALDLLAKDMVSEVVDPVLADFPLDQLLGFMAVALSCLEEESRLRPSMGEVIQMLNRVCDSLLTPFEMQQSNTPNLSAETESQVQVQVKEATETSATHSNTINTVSSSCDLVEIQSQTTMEFQMPTVGRGEYAAYARKKNMMPRNKA